MFIKRRQGFYHKFNNRDDNELGTLNDFGGWINDEVNQRIFFESYTGVDDFGFTNFNKFQSYYGFNKWNWFDLLEEKEKLNSKFEGEKINLHLYYPETFKKYSYIGIGIIIGLLYIGRVLIWSVKILRED